ncbi:hypothetical protein CALVIDRAFT_268970 [Calocera viscosa TUFC12733]|uniref:Uncharacterized protein n=1 Tax=Calocera viscosa (strain TUFC12733) TaxID=1330018 RepID=A0A167J1I6_CALVF|nr:hypothetical protein CALVIDRAFT_268970 [Calocera viscosa TUFC12733]
MRDIPTPPPVLLGVGGDRRRVSRMLRPASPFLHRLTGKADLMLRNLLARIVHCSGNHIPCAAVFPFPSPPCRALHQVAAPWLGTHTFRIQPPRPRRP